MNQGESMGLFGLKRQGFIELTNPETFSSPVCDQKYDSTRAKDLSSITHLGRQFREPCIEIYRLHANQILVWLVSCQYCNNIVTINLQPSGLLSAFEYFYCSSCGQRRFLFYIGNQLSSLQKCYVTSKETWAKTCSCRSARQTLQVLEFTVHSLILLLFLGYFGVLRVPTY